MANLKIVLAALLIFAGSVDADCTTPYQMCINITLKQSVTSSNQNLYFFPLKGHQTDNAGTYDQSGYDTGFENNQFGLPYVNQSLGNVYARVWNTTDANGVKWNGPYRTSQVWAVDYHADGGDTAYDYNISIIWVNRTDHLGSAGTGTPSILEICLNGSLAGNLVLHDPYAAPTPPSTWTVGPMFYIYPPCMAAATLGTDCFSDRIYPSNFTTYYVREWNFTDIKKVETATFVGKTASLEVYCDNLPKYSLNLTTINVSKKLVIQTIEQPRNILTYQGEIYVRQDLEKTLSDFFWVDSLLTQTLRHTLTLKDWTGGDWLGSTLYIQESTNMSWANIHVEKFPAEAKIYPYLRNNTQFHLILKTGDETTDLGYMYSSGVLERDINVNTPLTYKDGGVYANASVKWSMDYGTGQVGAVIVAANPGMQVNFSVYSTNGSQYVRVYNSNSKGSTVFAYTVADKQQQYYALVDVYEPSFGSHRFENLIRLYNTSLPLNASAFYTPLPSTFMGMSTITAKKIFSLIMSLFVMYVACKASDYGIGAIMGLALYGFFWFVNYLPHDQIPWWIILVQLVMAAAMKLTERRYQ